MLTERIREGLQARNLVSSMLKMQRKEAGRR